MIGETIARGARTIEPMQEAQAEWVRIIRETPVDLSPSQRECTPGHC